MTHDVLAAGELLAKLRATETRETYFTTSRTSPPAKGEYQALINPDGPEAANFLESLLAELTAANASLKEAEGVIEPFARGYEYAKALNDAGRTNDGRRYHPRDGVTFSDFRKAAQWLADREGRSE